MPMGLYADMWLDHIVFDGLPPVEEKKSDEDKHRNNKGLANQSKGKKNG
tara:strand:+ start:107 stop:253 length:147 start_codon:yes stop_codon:yes gene_type:complete